MPNFKHKLLLFIALVTSNTYLVTCFAQNVGIGSASFTPDPASMLEIQSTTSGLLIPRMTQAQRTAIAPTSSSDFGLMVYQTDGADGFYYWDGTQWLSLPNASAGWTTEGNTGTNKSTNFLGTTDDENLVFRTNNANRMVIDSNGSVGIGTTAPLSKLEVVGDILLTGNSALYSRDNEPITIAATSSNGVVNLNSTDGVRVNLQSVSEGSFSVGNPNGSIMSVNSVTSGIELGRNVWGATPLIISSAGGAGVSGQEGPILHIKGSDGQGTSANRGIFIYGGTGGAGSEGDVILSHDGASAIGNVGIGTTAPTAKLHVIGESSIQEIINFEGGNVHSTYNFKNNNTNGFATSQLLFYNTNNDLIASMVAQNDFLTGNGILRNSAFWSNGTKSTSAEIRGGDFRLYSSDIPVGSGFNFKGSTGNVGIGTISPTGKFHINNDGSGSDSSFVVMESGQVGIGTTTPSYNLDVTGGPAIFSGMGTFRVIEFGPNLDNFLVRVGSGVAGFSEAYLRGQSRGITMFANPQITDQTGTGGLYPAQTSGVNANSTFALVVNAAERLRVDGNGNVGLGTNSPTGKFHVNNDASGTDSSFVILENGNVGVANTNPLATINIGNQSTVADYLVRIDHLSTGSQRGIMFANNQGAQWLIGNTGDGTNALMIRDIDAGRNSFYIADGARDNSLFIGNTNNGNGWIGLATNSPTEVLDVNGNIRVRDSLQIGDGAKIAQHLSATDTWDPASIADGVLTSTTITVTSATVGDLVTVGHNQLTVAGVMLNAQVTAANTVTVNLLNKTGSAFDLASGTLRVGVWKY